MLVVYTSRTGNVERFIQKIDFPSVKIQQGLTVNQPFVLVLYTTGFGEAPKEALEFLKYNHQHLKGVAASGNRNWPSFAAAADVISQMYDVPILHKFELAGFKKDVQIFTERVRELSYEVHRAEQRSHEEERWLLSTLEGSRGHQGI